MRPKSDAAVYRPDLGQAVLEYTEDRPNDYIGLKVMPLFPTDYQAATYPVIPAEVLMSIQATNRKYGGKYPRSGFEYERGQFSTKEHGWEEPLDDGERKLVDQEGTGLADFVATERAWGIILRGQEKRIADTVFNESNFTANAVTNEWDDATNATPLDDVSDAMASMLVNPNCLIITYSTFLNLKRCDQVVDQLKYTFPGIDIAKMNSAQLAELFAVDQVLVAKAKYNTKGKNLDYSASQIWSNEHAMLTRIATNPLDLTEPCIGRTFLWKEDSPQNPIVEVYREEQIRSDVYRVRHNVDEALIKSVNDSGTTVSNVAQACSYLFSNITT